MFKHLEAEGLRPDALSLPTIRPTEVPLIGGSISKSFVRALDLGLGLGDQVRVVLRVDVPLDEVDESSQVQGESVPELLVDLADVDVFTPAQICLSCH